ncbi:MAG: hemin uptake protein HemP [Halocynthiibacter sp.]
MPNTPNDLSAPQTPIYDAKDLTDHNGTARITLNGQVYTLRITRAAKLILTK